MCTYKPKGGVQTAEEDETCVCKILVDEEAEEGDALERRTIAEGTNEASSAMEERGREGRKGEEEGGGWKEGEEKQPTKKF